ncbi:hypothetical protein GA0070616_0849 [Micromonospora nigra]|uniref:Uncharacterized protein n=1 Tax=Micromonospora nigra TaxID=145857 RepID=A0A1C6RFA8_9ACTN|nr:hypothetical protein [Micromonospora nigra]SCL15847.1 hypothetical protein GA0070616_0849 [Micromonospora nigra]
MNADELRRHVLRELAGARRTVVEHDTEAYTGICRSCGRPGPCDAQRAARARLHQRDALPQIRPASPVPPATRGPVMPPKLPGHEDAVDRLRDAWLATIAAADRAGGLLHGAGPPGRRLPWQDAVTECWRALGLVHAGLGEARAGSGNAGDLLAGLRLARADAHRAAAEAARTRWWLAAAEDRLRRRHRAAVDPPRRTDARLPDHARQAGELAAANRFRAAVARLDLVAARLALGGRAIDRWAAALAGDPEPTPALPPHRVATAQPSATAQATAQEAAQATARGARAAAALVVAGTRRNDRRAAAGLPGSPQHPRSRQNRGRWNRA